MPNFKLPPVTQGSPFGDLRMSHACVRVPDYEAGKAWYIDKLDFRFVVEWPGPLDVQMCYLAAPNDDRCVIEVVGDGDAPEMRDPPADLFSSLSRGGYHHLCFTVGDVDATVARLRDRDVTIFAEPFEVPDIGRRLAFVSDPFGNLIEFEQVLA